MLQVGRSSVMLYLPCLHCQKFEFVISDLVANVYMRQYMVQILSESMTYDVLQLPDKQYKSIVEILISLTSWLMFVLVAACCGPAHVCSVIAISNMQIPGWLLKLGVMCV